MADVPLKPHVSPVVLHDREGNPIDTGVGPGGEVLIYAVNPNRATFKTAKLVPAAAGTAEQGPDQAVPNGFSVVVKALKANAGLVYVGESKAIAEGADAYPLDASKGEFIRLFVTNMNAIWINSVDAGNADGVSFIVEV